MHFFQHRREKVPVNGINGGNAHVPTPEPAQVVKLFTHAGKVLLPVFGGMQQQLPRRRQPQSGGMPFKQRHRQLFLHPQDLPVDRGRGNVQGF